MPHRNMRLGQAMAYLAELSPPTKPKGGDLSDSKVLYIEVLEQEMRRIREQGEATSIIGSHAGSCCDKNAGIDGDEAFFLSCLVVGEGSVEQSEVVASFMEHLNNCYACFCAFSEVFRDYYQQRMTLGDKSLPS